MATVYSMICFGGRTGKTVTFTDAGDIVNLNNNGLPNGWAGVFSTTGSLPAGLTAGVTYYARQGSDANKFTLHPTANDAIAGTAQITFSGTGSGTHTLKSAYFLSLSADQKARYGSAGSERIYDGLQSWNTARAGASSFDTEVCEIGEAWTEIQTGAFQITVPSASTIVTTTVDGVRSAGFHNGTVGAGYIYRYNQTSVSAIQLSKYRQTLDGFSVHCAIGGSPVAVNVAASACSVQRMILQGSAGSTKGLALSGQLLAIEGNLILGFNTGVELNQYGNATLFANNTIVKNVAYGMDTISGTTSAIYGYYYNNIVIGNGTNWRAQSSNVEKASANAGLSTDSPWLTSGGTVISMTTADFADYANNDFRPALSTSPQVETGVTYYGALAYDIADDARPNYINGTTDKYDAGAYEYDHGNGLKPISVPVALTNLIDGMRVKIEKTADGTELYNGVVSGTSLSYTQIVGGDTPVTIFARKGSAAPFYHPFQTTATIDDANGLALSLSPVSTIAAAAYSAGVATDWAINTGTGAITHASGTARYEVQDLYSWLLDYYDDAATVDLAMPIYGITPTIFTLINSGSISDADKQFLKGGSIEEQDGTLWSNVYSDGTITGNPAMYVVQSGSKISSFWSAGHIDILVKAGNAGALIDSGLVTVYARKYGYTYDHYQVNLSEGGRNVAPIGTQVDANNQTAEATVAAYADISYTFGAVSKDLGEGAGAATYYCAIDCAGRSLAEVYEHTKYVTRDESAATLNGAPGWRYQAAHANYTPNKASPFGTFAGGRWLVAQGVWLDNVASSDTYNYELTDHSGATHALTQPDGSVTATLMANTRIVLFNATTGVEIDNAMVSGAYSKTITTEASINDVLTLHYFKTGYLEGKSTLIWSGATAAFVVSYEADEVENALLAELGVTGADCTEFTPDTTGHVYIEFNDADGVTMKARLAIWYKYILTTEQGARHFRGGMTLLSTAAFRINAGAVNILLENVNASTAVRFSDVQRRLYRDDGSSLIAPTSYSIHNDYSGVPDVVETGVSGLTGAESAQLMGLPSASAVASSVWDADQADLLTALAKIHGLIAGTPLVVTPTTRVAGDITQSIVQTGNNVTVSRA